MNTPTIIVKINGACFPQPEQRLKALITNRDSYNLTGYGGNTPAFSGTATTVSGREVAVKADGENGWDATITITYPGTRQGYGLVEQIVGELLQGEERSSADEMPPPPEGWEGMRTFIPHHLHPECTGWGEQIEWGWVRTYPQTTIGWFWKPITPTTGA